MNFITTIELFGAMIPPDHCVFFAYVFTSAFSALFVPRTIYFLKYFLDNFFITSCRNYSQLYFDALTKRAKLNDHYF